MAQPLMFMMMMMMMMCDRTPLVWINWDGEPSAYAENPDNWIFFLV
jgi:hypothetical protein